MARPQAVLFDLNDTLVDRRKSLARFAASFALSFATDLVDSEEAALCAAFYEADRGGYRTRDELFASLRQQLPWRIVPTTEELSAYWDEHFHGCAEATSGLYETLDWLREHEFKLGLVTNGGSVAQHTKIGSLDILSYFDSVVISEEIRVKKPDKRVFQHALRELVSARARHYSSATIQ